MPESTASTLKACDVPTHLLQALATEPETKDAYKADRPLSHWKGTIG